MMESPKKLAMDIMVERPSKWRWLILLAGWLSFGLFSGTLYTSGLFYVVYLQEFNSDRFSTAWVGSLCSSVYLMYGPLVASAIDRWGCRVVLMCSGVVACLSHIGSCLATGLTSLYFSHGLLLAIPLAIVHTGWIVAVAEVFPGKMRGMATGLLMTGGGAGLFLMPPLLRTLMDVYGWRGTYLILGGLALNWVATGATVFPSGGWPTGKKQVVEEADEVLDQEKPSYWKVISCPPVIWFNLMSFFWMFSGGTMFIIFKDLLIQRDMEADYQLCLQLVGLGDLAGRFLAGFSSSKLLNPPPLLQNLSVHIISCLVFIFFCIPTTSSILNYLLFFTFGVIWGAQNLYLAVAPASLLGTQYISTVLGTFLFSAGVGQLIGPPLFGWLVDIRGGYLEALFSATMAQFLASVSAALGTFLHFRRG